MRKVTIALIALALCVLVAVPSFAANSVRISMVYGGSTNSVPNNAWMQDFVELFNSSGSAVNISGWSIQYGSSLGTTNLGACTNCLMVIPQSTYIQPCSYLLLGFKKGTSGTAITPDIDFAALLGNSSVLDLSGTNGKVALKADGVATPCSPQNAFVDLVGFGPTTNCSETSPTPSISATTWAVRNANGLNDTDNNNADFTVGSSPSPRTAATPPLPDCLIVPTLPSSWGQVKAYYR
jgi:hypothetical protein